MESTIKVKRKKAQSHRPESELAVESAAVVRRRRRRRHANIKEPAQKRMHKNVKRH